jgi:hypothetical protein
VSKFIRILKAAGEYCTIGAGVATIFISVAAAFVALPVFVTFVVAGGIGLICAAIGAHNEANQIEVEAVQEERQAMRQREALAEMKKELAEIKSDLELHHKNISSRRETPDDYPHLDQAESRLGKMQRKAQRLHVGEQSLFSHPSNAAYLNSPEDAKRQPVNDRTMSDRPQVIVMQRKLNPRTGH